MSLDLKCSTNISKSSLRLYAVKAYEDDRDSSRLDACDVKLLENAILHADNNTSYEGYGPLAKPTGERMANNSMIEWFAHTVAHFAPIRYLGSNLFAPTCLFVDATMVQISIDHFLAAGSPSSGYQIPTFNGFNEVDSFSRLHLQLGLGGVVGGPGLESIPGWYRIAFLIHDSNHWSVVVYIRSKSGDYLVHYDSITSFHAERAMQLAAMLRAAGLIKRDLQLTRTAQANQKGSWNCGYCVMARLYEQSLGSNKFSADKVIDNENSDLRDFLRFIKLKNALAATLGVLSFRWNRIFQQK
jgi:hypothetical protein